MADEIIDFLKERFNRIDAQLSAMRSDHHELMQRIARMEQEGLATRRDISMLHADWAILNGRLDGFAERLHRIERRLDLVEG